MKKILITGGAGFIGFNLAKKLAEDPNNNIHICDNLSKPRYDDEFDIFLKEHPNIKFFQYDLTDNRIYKNFDEDYNQIYHLAAVVGVKYADENPDQVIRINTISTINLLEWIKKYKSVKILFASSCENYAGSLKRNLISIPTPEEIPLTIDNIKIPRYSYAASKILGELAMINYSRIYGFETTIVRYHNVYGPRMGFVHVIPEFSIRLLRKEDPFKIYGSNQTRTFCYVDDAVRATIGVMESDKTNLEIVNIGDDKNEIVINDLAEKLFEIADYHPKIIDMPAPLGSINRRCPNIIKLTNLMGYSSNVDLDEGLLKTYIWYRNFVAKYGFPDSLTSN